MYLSTITLAEIAYALAALPDGGRRRSLESRFARFVGSGFEHRVLGFDVEAAVLYGEIMARRKSLGRPMSVLDGQIAAIARAHGFGIATGNVRDFEACGVSVLDPFRDAS